MKRICILLITVALIAGTVGCGSTPAQYELTITCTAGGSVTTPGEDTFTYGELTVVNLVAEAEEGYYFVNWSGDVGTVANVEAASTTITMNGDYSIAANYCSATIVVPDDYATIQQAIDVICAGGTVYVRSGTYYENITIDKPLTLRGEDRETTVVDGSGSGDTVCISADHVTLENLQVINGMNGVCLPPADYYSHLTLRNVIIDSNENHAISDCHTGGYWLIEDCIISNNGGGALQQAHQADQFIIRNCEVFGNGGPLDLGWGSNAVVENNSIHDNGGGINFDSMFDSVITGNNISGNSDYGIAVIYVASNNTVRDNIICDNGYGIYINTGSGGNKFYHNDLIGNDVQAYDQQYVGVWDNGYPSGGNYWSDYTGVDNYSGPSQDVPGSDGIGDTPYTFSGNQDNYPLMEAVNYTSAQCVAAATNNDTVTEGLEEPWNITAVTNPDIRNHSYIWNIVDGETYPF